MSYPTQQIFRPVEANVDLSQLQFSQFPNRHLQVADYSQVEFLQPSDSEEEMGDEAMNYSYENSKSCSLFNKQKKPNHNNNITLTRLMCRRCWG